MTSQKVAIIDKIFTCSEVTEVIDGCKLTESDQSMVQSETREQTKSKEWWINRMGRVNASSIDSIICNPSPDKWQRQSQKVLDRHKRVFAPPIDYGHKMEPVARKAYLDFMKKMYPNIDIKIDQVGLFVHESGYASASPDGIVHMGNQKIWLEIKCPYALRSCNKDQIRQYLEARDGKFWFNYNEEGHVEFNMKSSQGRKYYHQVQCGLWISHLTYCHFVIWTPLHMEIFKVDIDPKWREKHEHDIIEYWGIYLLPYLIQNKNKLRTWMDNIEVYEED